MAIHGTLMSDFTSADKQGVEEGSSASGIDLSALEQRRLSLSMALHTADVSNPAKPQKLMAEWTKRVMTEFWAQGDAEKERGWRPSQAMFDREVSVTAHKSNNAACACMVDVDAYSAPTFFAWVVISRVWVAI